METINQEHKGKEGSRCNYNTLSSYKRLRIESYTKKSTMRHWLILASQLTSLASLLA